MMLHDCLHNIWLPKVRSLYRQLADLTHGLSDLAFLTRTHGQAATPSTLGKEIGVFAYRLRRQLEIAKKSEILGKFNGAVGTFSAHALAYPTAPGKTSRGSSSKASASSTIR
jgi:adenylosuccinate lyase